MKKQQIQKSSKEGGVFILHTYYWPKYWSLAPNMILRTHTSDLQELSQGTVSKTPKKLLKKRNKNLQGI